jgi:hypothetical protein
MSSQQLLARADAVPVSTDRHSYVSARIVGSHARSAAAGERLLRGESAAFLAMIDTVHDEEDFGDAFTFVD